MLPDKDNTAPTAQTGEPARSAIEDDGWLRRASDAYRSSTSYVDKNLRKDWEDAIRAFNNQHPTDSKYTSPAYDKRSKLYRPKIRAVMRKNEAATAAAFFSNMDVVSIDASDQTDKAQLISADVMKQVIQYRLTRSVPWFQFVLGGLQDAQTVGAVIGYLYWDYDKNSGVDKPCLELVPVENFRVDPSASWIDPIGTSPYLIHLIPMYSMDIKEKIESGEWHEVSLKKANSKTDSTRIARSGGDDPQTNDDRPVSDYEILWVQRHIHRKDGQDWVFHTLDDDQMLDDPQPLKNVYFHGRRPYVFGRVILETHKIFSSGVPKLGRGVEDEVNEVTNQRMDNVKFALNKKWFAKRGVDVDLAGLVRNVPGGIVMMNDPEKDVREITWPDVTQSAFMEQQGLDMLMDELLGNFNPAALMTQGAGNAPARNMSLLSQSNGSLVEYLIRTYVETFIEPVLRLLVLLEQEYETDRVIMGLAAKNSKMFQRFGIDSITDDLLMQEITLKVNVGMGATDPAQKLSKFLAALMNFSAIMKSPPPGMNLVEVGKEIFGHLGYADGSRFFTVDDPQIIALQQQLQQAMQMIQQLQMKLQEKNTKEVLGYKKTIHTNQTKAQIALNHELHEDRRNLATHWTALTMNHNTVQAQRMAKQQEGKSGNSTR